MDILARAQSDTARILTQRNGAAVRAFVCPPGASRALPVNGFHVDTSAAVDPDTGTHVSARQVSISVPDSEFLRHGWTVPDRVVGVSWVFRIGTGVYTLRETMPDRTLGLTVYILEVYAGD